MQKELDEAREVIKTLEVEREKGGVTDTNSDGSSDAEASLVSTFMSEADDYCGGLSGGQRAKLEVIRSVFLHPACPPLLLLDEPFAALDAHSKTALMHKLQRFCTESVVIVVYHPERDDDNVCDSQRGFDGVVEVRSGALIPPRACHL